MPYFHITGSDTRVSRDADLRVDTKLAPHTYIIKKSLDGLYLRRVEPFALPKRLYGDVDARAERILTTFQDRSNSTGVLLAGDRGSGKTLLAKMLSIRAAEMGYPTILVNSAWTGDEFFQLIQDVGDAVILFDEVEKVYDSDEQDEILTLLDGVVSTRNLFILTCNNKYGVSSHMRNRPGRIFYLFDYGGLDEPTIRDYCADKGVSDDDTEEIVRIAMCFKPFSFDSLQAVVEESARYGERPSVAITNLNIRPEFMDQTSFTVELSFEGESRTLLDDHWYGNPIKDVVEITCLTTSDSSDDEDDECQELSFEPSDIRSVTRDRGFVLERDGYRVVLKRARRGSFDIGNLF